MPIWISTVAGDQRPWPSFSWRKVSLISLVIGIVTMTVFRPVNYYVLRTVPQVHMHCASNVYGSLNKYEKHCLNTFH